MYNVGLDNFGKKDKQQPRGSEQEFKGGREREFRHTTQRFRTSEKEEILILSELQANIREKFSRRTERNRKRNERARARALFTTNPFQFT